MDLAYLRAHPDQLPTFLTHQRIRETPVHGGSISAASRLTLDDGHSVFAKQWPEDSSRTAPGPRRRQRPDGFFAAEAAGIAWLRVEGGAQVPEIVAATDDLIALNWIDEVAPTATAAREFGAALARTHAKGAETFGAQWPGFIGALPLDNGALPLANTETAHADPHQIQPGHTELTSGDPHRIQPSHSELTSAEPAGTESTAPNPARPNARTPWSRWFGERRLRPYLEMSVESGALTAEDAAEVAQLIADIGVYAGAADAEPPARIHGDLWPGNLLWSASGVVMIDPAAHGGHRETDLATLSLFGGAPHLGEILAGYEREQPLADGWRERVPLHQLHLLLVHTAMFGGGYRDAVMGAVRATVGA